MNKRLLTVLGELSDYFGDTISDEAEQTRKTLPDLTCPNIDKVLIAIREVDKISGCDNSDDPKDAFDDINRAVWGMDDELEILRKSNDSLRQLSAGWRRVATLMKDHIDATFKRESASKSLPLPGAITWHPMETEPKDGDDCLILRNDGRKIAAYWDGEAWWFCSGAFAAWRKDVTHWASIGADVEGPIQGEKL